MKTTAQRRIDLTESLDHDLRGQDIRGVDLRGADDLVLRELVDCDEDSGWVPLAAWDGATRFADPVQERLSVLGLMEPARLEDDSWHREALARGRRAKRRIPTIDKTIPGGSEFESGWWADG